MVQYVFYFPVNYEWKNKYIYIIIILWLHYVGLHKDSMFKIMATEGFPFNTIDACVYNTRN